MRLLEETIVPLLNTIPVVFSSDQVMAIMQRLQSVDGKTEFSGHVPPAWGAVATMLRELTRTTAYACEPPFAPEMYFRLRSCLTHLPEIEEGGAVTLEDIEKQYQRRWSALRAYDKARKQLLRRAGMAATRCLARSMADGR